MSATKQEILTPEWVKDAVFYQIFPDRFAKSSRVPKSPLLQPWDSPPTTKGYKGGDLLGIVEHLDHLTDLGINAIYLNPIFQSGCNHRYHAHDYYQVDPMLGGNEALRELVTAAHQRGIRIVLDGVFNHASRGFFQFHDVLEQGAASAYADWFIIHDYPLHPYDHSKPANYEAWAGLRDLPKLNTDNPVVREFIMEIAEYWIREFDIDGWRLDVAEEIRTPGFWEEFRQRVKAAKSDAYIVAEIWHEAAEWLQGNQFDATMNYEFTSAAIAFTGGDRISYELVKDRGYNPYPGIDAANYAAKINRLLALYHWPITLVQLNSLDSHDTARLTSIARGDKDTLRLATLLQMTYPGAPCIYYGDEIGIKGSADTEKPLDDSEARWAFPWEAPDSWDTELLNYFREIITLRHEVQSLRRGEYIPLFAEGEVLVFARHFAAEFVLVAVNVGREEATVTVSGRNHWMPGTQMALLFGRGTISPVQDDQITMTLPARQGMVCK
jgi:cyclomaltodextrinase